jgi:hypothetical protein
VSGLLACSRLRESHNYQLAGERSRADCWRRARTGAIVSLRRRPHQRGARPLVLSSAVVVVAVVVVAVVFVAAAGRFGPLISAIWARVSCAPALSGQLTRPAVRAGRVHILMMMILFAGVSRDGDGHRDGPRRRKSCSTSAAGGRVTCWPSTSSYASRAGSRFSRAKRAHSPLANGESISKWTKMAPPLEPISVISLGEPPNERTFAWIQCRAATWSSRPRLAREPPASRGGKPSV